MNPDLSSWNCEFSDIYPVFTNKVINILEREFLGALSYNLYISGGTYAQYYFHLRAMRDAKNPRVAPQRIPSPLQPMPILKVIDSCFLALLAQVLLNMRGPLHLPFISPIHRIQLSSLQML